MVSQIFLRTYGYRSLTLGLNAGKDNSEQTANNIKEVSNGTIKLRSLVFSLLVKIIVLEESSADNHKNRAVSPTVFQHSKYCQKCRNPVPNGSKAKKNISICEHILNHSTVRISILVLFL